MLNSCSLRLQIKENPWEALKHMWSFSSSLGGLLTQSLVSTPASLLENVKHVDSNSLSFSSGTPRPLTLIPVQLLSQSHQGSKKKKQIFAEDFTSGKKTWTGANFLAYTNTGLVYFSLLNSEHVSSESKNRWCWWASWKQMFVCLQQTVRRKTCWASSDLKFGVWSDCASRIVGLELCDSIDPAMSLLRAEMPEHESL